MAATFDVLNALERRTPLPTGLSAAQWLKGGAPISTTETGKALALVLAKLETLYKRVDIDQLRPPKGKTFQALADLEGAEKQAKAAYRDQVVPLVSHGLEVKKQALATLKLCQGHAAVPKPVLLLLAEMVQLLDCLMEGLKDLGALFKPFDDARQALASDASHLRKTLLPHLTALNKGLDACLKTPSREVWDKLCKPPCKAIHHAIQNSPSLKVELWGTWKVHDGDSFSHALQVAEKSALKDPKAQQKLQEVITRMCKDLKKEMQRVEGLL